MYHHIRNLVSLMDFNAITDTRKTTLQSLANAIQQNIAEKGSAKLNFICTHNSRRSQMAQVWATVAAYHHKCNVTAFSGGTEATAVAPQVLTALDYFGFDVEKSASKNGKQLLSFNSMSSAISLHSKKYNSATNPKTDFIAVMTCSDADDNCPLVEGCSERIPLTYHDPKHFDGSLLESTMYQYECFRIGQEIFYAFSLLKKS